MRAGVFAAVILAGGFGRAAQDTAERRMDGRSPDIRQMTVDNVRRSAGREYTKTENALARSSMQEA